MISTIKLFSNVTDADTFINRRPISMFRSNPMRIKANVIILTAPPKCVDMLDLISLD